jgi:hypothetical protein
MIIADRQPGSRYIKSNFYATVREAIEINLDFSLAAMAAMSYYLTIARG